MGAPETRCQSSGGGGPVNQHPHTGRDPPAPMVMPGGLLVSPRLYRAALVSALSFARPWGQHERARVGGRLSKILG